MLSLAEKNENPKARQLRSPSFLQMLLVVSQKPMPGLPPLGNWPSFVSRTLTEFRYTVIVSPSTVAFKTSPSAHPISAFPI